jgi:hypothetical protein
MSTTTGRETADRQRQRAERGIGTTRRTGGRLPANTKRRRPAVAALAALLIVGGALIAGLLAIRMDERQAVVQIAQNVGVGEQITMADLAETQVASDSLSVWPANRAKELIGAYAKVNLVKGQLLDPKQLTKDSPIAEGKAAVGIVLVNGRIPAAGLHNGDLVELVRISSGNQPPVVLGNGTIMGTPTQSSSTTLGDKASTAQSATVLIDQDMVKTVTDASGNNRIAVGLLKSGQSVGPK